MAMCFLDDPTIAARKGGKKVTEADGQLRMIIVINTAIDVRQRRIHDRYENDRC